MVSFGICMQALCLVVLWLAMEPAGLADLYSCHITSEYLGPILVFLKCQKDRNACITLSCTKQSVDCLDDSHLFLDAAFSAFSVRSSINGKIP